MDEKYIWPLVGVALGWFLSFFASWLKDREDNRKSLGRLLTKLLAVLEQVKTLKSVSEQYKDFSENWEDYERMRKHISDRHFLEPSSHIDSLTKSIEEVAGIYPLEAIELQGLMGALLKNKKMSLSASSKSKELYIRFLSVYEVSLDACETKLQEHILRFARRHGPFTFIKIRQKLLGKGRFATANEVFLKKFMEDAHAEIKKIPDDGLQS